MTNLKNQQQPVCPNCERPEISARLMTHWDVFSQSWKQTHPHDGQYHCEYLDCGTGELDFSELVWRDTPTTDGETAK